MRTVARVLAGEQPYDSVGEFDQSAVRAAWEGKIEDAIDALNYEDEFLEAGESWAEADAAGNLVIRNAASPTG